MRLGSGGGDTCDWAVAAVTHATGLWGGDTCDWAVAAASSIKGGLIDRWITIQRVVLVGSVS
eukprot:217044-Chlamydomonas_euryale.AAC.1